MVGGAVCSIDVSPDGARVAVVTRGADFSDACSELYVLPVRPPGAAPVHTSLQADRVLVGGYRGVTSLAFAPDGTQLVVESDHAEGCPGGDCGTREYVVDASSAGYRSLSTYSHDPSSLVWLPP